MKLFEIGDGLKSIEFPDNYCYDDEDDSTVIVYDPEIDPVGIRISTITVKPKDDADTNIAYERVIRNGSKDGHKVEIVNEKSFFTYTQDSEENGEQLNLFFFEIGYKCHFIVISVTAPAEYAQNNEEVIENILADVTQSISTIEEVSAEQSTIFEPPYQDIQQINERISKILNIDESDIDRYHENGKSISLIQKILDKKTIGAEQTHELQSLGLVMGDYIRYKNHNYRWAIIRDEDGRDPCLRHNKLSLTIFPMTMISNRVEDGESVVVEELIAWLMDKINELEESGECKESD